MLNCEFSDESSILSKSISIKIYINKMLKIIIFFIELKKKVKEKLSTIIQSILRKSPFKNKREEIIVPPLTYKGVEHELDDLNYFSALQDYDVFWHKYIKNNMKFIIFVVNFFRNLKNYLKIFSYYFLFIVSFFFFLFDEYFHILPPYIIKIF